MNVERMVGKQTKVIGKAIRTTNQNGQSIQDQSAFWQKFFLEETWEKIPGKLNPGRIFGVYSDYESDFTGAYTFMIGFEAEGSEKVPEGFTEIVIPAGKYSVFENNDKMNLAEKVGKIWRNIWESGIKRSYLIDFESYNLSTMQTDNPEVSVYIGIK